MVIFHGDLVVCCNGLTMVIFHEKWDFNYDLMGFYSDSMGYYWDTRPGKLTVCY